MILHKFVFIELLEERKISLQTCKQMLADGNLAGTQIILTNLEKNINRLFRYKIED